MNLQQTVAIFAEATGGRPGASAVSELLVLSVPLVVIVILVVVLLNRVQKWVKPLQDRSLEHMDRIESKTDEVIAVLREIRDRLGGGGR